MSGTTRTYREREGAFGITFLGEAGVGKSCFALRSLGYEFGEDYDPTLFDSHKKHKMIGPESVCLRLLDTSGQEEFNNLEEHILQSSGVLIFYSITDPYSFKRVTDFYDLVQRCCSELPVVLVATKSDLNDGRAISPQDGQILAQQWGIPFLETSAKTKDNLEEAFDLLILGMREREAKTGGPSSANKPGNRESLLRRFTLSLRSKTKSLE
eukprot:c47515_g1_i1.p1 GENE.c47515_g1_i1~~c47515_g1_i1.p1  ORF type:complete len:211 (-),score=34.13 c47515_g1_i1:8-640(-)